jgi:hypothetical protein
VELSSMNNRTLAGYVALAALAVAAVGFALGTKAGTTVRARSPEHGERLQPAPSSGTAVGAVRIALPPEWVVASHTRTIPGMVLDRPLVYAPGGDGSATGLLIGVDRQAAPLPPAFVARLPALPAAEVLSLHHAHVLRYGGLRPASEEGQLLTAYAVPGASAPATVLVCYAPATEAGFAFMRSCEATVATLVASSTAGGAGAAPDAAYGSEVSTALAGLDGERAALRARMAAGADAATVASLSRQLSASYARAASSLASLKAPTAATQAQSALAAALRSTGTGYGRLASAAAAAGSEGYGAARANVEREEASIGSALQAYGLLGYQP